MWTEVFVLVPTVLVVSAVAVGHRRHFTLASPSWRLLSGSGLFLSGLGLVWVLRAWVPTPGPYRVAELYPFGTHVQAWQVTFGFTWLAFGLLFFSTSLRWASAPARSTWLMLAAAWAVCMFPHGVIGVSMALRGEDVGEVVGITARADSGEGLALLLATGLVGFCFLVSSAIGFSWTWWELRRGPL